ncbi:MAG: NAD-dependent epimerase/dehydratase family protein [Reyranellaceae bacterium]
MAPLVAVTGATGFVGQALVPRLLAAGHRVRILARQLPQFAPGGAGPVELVLGDLGQADALDRLVEGADAVLHLAGLVKAARKADFFAVNRDGVAALLAAIARRAASHRPDGQGGGPRFILLSSLAAREPGLSPYAASKRAGEEALRHTAHGLPWLALRAPVVYGPGDRETLAFFKAAQRGFAPVAGDGSGRISAIHVEDLAELLCRLATAYLPLADAYEADDGAPDGYSLGEFAQAAAGALGRPVRPVKLPRPVMAAAASSVQALTMLDGRPRILSPAKVREMFHPDWVSRDRRLAAFLGWSARIRLAEGFAGTIAWYRRRRWL